MRAPAAVVSAALESSSARVEREQESCGSDIFVGQRQRYDFSGERGEVEVVQE
jgi:hypothetical protein